LPVSEFPRDENSAPDQEDQGKPAPADAHHAKGVPGAEPPIETDARAGPRDRTPAGFNSKIDNNIII
jgi:hypothetical protein